LHCGRNTLILFTVKRGIQGACDPLSLKKDKMTTP
jgi:hypothetical protein